MGTTPVVRHKAKTVRRLVLLLVSALVASGLVVTGSPPVSALATQTASSLNETFTTYGDTSGVWSGGDGTASVPLPDGGVAWLFSDTYLGGVNADATRASNSTMINNSMVVQSTSGLATVTGGTTLARTALLPPVDEDFFWVGSGTTSQGKLHALYSRYGRSGQGALDVALKGTVLATIDLSTFTVTSTTALPLGSSIAWGSDTVVDGSTVYVYGSEYISDTGMRFAHVARTNADYSQAWEFWDGAGWSTNEVDSARLISGVGTAFGVQRIGTSWVLVTQQANLIFSPDIVAYPMEGPTGPFGDPVPLLTTPEPATPGLIVYDTHVHPSLAPSGKMLWSYNVNSLNPDDNMNDAHIYRPRFVETPWPLTSADPALLPSSPTAPAATDLGDGSATITWPAVEGASGYRLYRRDVTAGQTHFARENATFTNTTATTGMLRDGHRYEFRVSAVNGAGEGSASTTTALTISVPIPSAPQGVTAAPNGSTGGVTVTWQPSSHAWGYEVYYREASSPLPDFTLATSAGGTATSLAVRDLTPDSPHEFYVVATGPGGSSAPSATVTGTPVRVAPSPPTALTAQATTTGSIRLSWTASTTPNTWYWVYQRDVTEGQATPDKLPLPITTNAMEAGYLKDDHTYEFTVTAYDSGGESAQSGPARATAEIAPPTAAPTGLTATPGSGQAVLSWTGPAPDLWYVVKQRNVTAGETTFSELPLPITATTMTAGYLVNDNTYEFKVAALNGGGQGPDSAVVQVTPTVPPPPVVTGITATAQSDGSIKVSWTDQPESLFWVWMRDVTAGETLKRLEYPTDKNTFTATMLKHQHVYEFKIQPNAYGKDGPNSSAVRATSTYQLPPAPTNLSAKAMGDATIRLDWDGPTGVYYWVSIRDVTAGETTFTQGVWPTDKTSADLGWMKAGHLYEFKVRAENQAGVGPFSNVAKATSYGGLPAAPTNLKATAQDGQVALSWTASTTSGVQYMIHQRDVTNGGSWKQLPLPVTGTSMTAGYLTNGVTYEFKVTAASSIGQSAPSNVVSARPLPPLPTRPATLSASAKDGAVDLSWSASTPSSVFYIIEYRSTGGSWTRMPLPVSGTSLRVTPLANGTTYEFRVRANNLAGDSSWSPSAYAKPMPPKPTAPPTLTATAGDRKVTLSWGAATPSAVYYLVDYRVVGTSTWTRMAFPVDARTLTVTPLVNGTTYEFRVFATNLAGTSGASPVASAKPLPPLPGAPTWLAREEDEGSLYMRMGGTATDLKYYKVYYRNLTRGTAEVATIQYSNIARLPLIESEVYAVRVTMVNLKGEGPYSSTWTAVTEPTLSHGETRRSTNRVNGANATANTYKLGLACRNAARQTICFERSPGGSRPMTVGDYVFYPRSESAFKAKMRCDALQTKDLRLRSGSFNTAWNQGPHLMLHETIHSDQMNAYAKYTDFVAAYGAAEAVARAKGTVNVFEEDANAYWGWYRSAAGVEWCDY